MTLRWGILSTGRIAGAFAKATAASKTGTIVAVASRTRDKAEAFGAEHNIPRRHASYEALLADSRVEAVYIATPHPMHAEWAIKAAEAGKHILLEKPMTMNHREAVQVVDAARKHDVFLMEAFAYRCHPQTAMAVSRIREGVIGDVRMIEATLGFHAPRDLDNRILNRKLGGGGILDVGCYCVSIARLIAGIATGKASADPEDLTAGGLIGPESGVDEYTAALLRFQGGIIAHLACSVQVPMEHVLRVYGTEGKLWIPVPWAPGLSGEPSSIFIQREEDARPTEIVINPQAGLFTIEVDTVAANIPSRQAPTPAMTWEDSLGNMKTLDRWREAIGLRFEMD